MAMYCLNMLSIALELAREEEEYEDVASKFWEHFVHIARAMNTMGLWTSRTASITTSSTAAARRLRCASGPWWG